MGPDQIIQLAFVGLIGVMIYVNGYQHGKRVGLKEGADLVLGSLAQSPTGESRG